jgi:hypothetical protein
MPKQKPGFLLDESDDFKPRFAHLVDKDGKPKQDLLKKLVEDTNKSNGK